MTNLMCEVVLGVDIGVVDSYSLQRTYQFGKQCANCMDYCHDCLVLRVPLSIYTWIRSMQNPSSNRVEF